MKGLDWTNERYVREHTRDTPAWALLGYPTQCLWLQLLRKMDRAGVIPLDPQALPHECVAAMLPGCEPKAVDVQLRRLVDRKWLVHNEQECCLVDPDFLDREEAAMSDAQRQREARARRREAKLSRTVTEASRNVAEPSQPVTAGHALSRAVTPSSPPVPSVPSDPTQPRVGTSSPAADAAKGADLHPYCTPALIGGDAQDDADRTHHGPNRSLPVPSVQDLHVAPPATEPADPGGGGRDGGDDGDGQGIRRPLPAGGGDLATEPASGSTGEIPLGRSAQAGAGLLCAHCHKPTAGRQGRNAAGAVVICARHHLLDGERCPGYDMEAIRGEPPPKEPRRSSEHSAALDRMVAWFGEKEVLPPQNGNAVSYGHLTGWMTDCGGEKGKPATWSGAADRAISILEHGHRAVKIGPGRGWGYVAVLIKDYGATGMPRGNGGRRRKGGSLGHLSKAMQREIDEMETK